MLAHTGHVCVCRRGITRVVSPWISIYMREQFRSGSTVSCGPDPTDECVCVCERANDQICQIWTYISQIWQVLSRCYLTPRLWVFAQFTQADQN